MVFRGNDLGLPCLAQLWSGIWSCPSWRGSLCEQIVTGRQTTFVWGGIFKYKILNQSRTWMWFARWTPSLRHQFYRCFVSSDSPGKWKWCQAIKNELSDVMFWREKRKQNQNRKVVDLDESWSIRRIESWRSYSWVISFFTCIWNHFSKSFKFEEKIQTL